jgi:predicted amino acid-binding ACT domain protein
MVCEKEGIINKLDERLARTEGSLTDINKNLISIDQTLIRNTVSLEHHVLRSDRLEIIVDKIEKRSYELAKKQQYMLGIIAVISIILPIILKFLQ